MHIIENTVSIWTKVGRPFREAPPQPPPPPLRPRSTPPAHNETQTPLLQLLQKNYCHKGCNQIHTNQQALQIEQLKQQDADSSVTSSMDKPSSSSYQQEEDLR